MDLKSQKAASSSTSFHFSASFGDASFSASGDAEPVFKAWAEFLEHVPATSHNQRTEKNKSVSPAGDHDKQPLSVFLERVGKTDSNPEIAAAIVHWARRQQGTQEIGPNDVKDLWRLTKHKVPGNVPRELARAAQNGWVERAGGGKYRITGHGEDFINT